MPLIVLTGGARSGKSRLAARTAADTGREVVFVATAEDGRDDEFSARIARHRAARPAGWRVVEEPIELGQALSGIAPAACVIVDCLSLWVANLVERGLADDDALAAARDAAELAAGRPGLAIGVTNEVGLGVVPAHPVARRYRDLLGAVNSAWVDAADEAVLVVAGRGLRLEPWAGPR